jgi:hypothetical protein
MNNKQTKKPVTIPLKNSDKTATIDADMYPLISQFNWYLTKDGFAATTIAGEIVLMHDLIMKSDFSAALLH